MVSCRNWQPARWKDPRWRSPASGLPQSSSTCTPRAARRAAGHRVRRPAPAGPARRLWWRAAGTPLTDPQLGWLLRVALYQLAYTRAPAACHGEQRCRRGGPGQAAGLANAVLRNFQRRPPAGQHRRRPAVRTLAASRLVDRQTESRVPTINGRPYSKPACCIRPLPCASTAAMATPQAICGPNEAGMRAIKPARRPSASTARCRSQAARLRCGHVSVQDAGAQWAAQLLDVHRGMRVLDACAAPGGKTGHILELPDMGLVALDVDGRRLGRVQQNLERLGLSADPGWGDAAHPESGGMAGRLTGFWLTCRARPGRGAAQSGYQVASTPRRYRGFARRQGVILDALWRPLAPGGKLLYATCSIFIEENENQIGAFLRPTRERQHWTSPALDKGQLLPDDQHDGFYYALLEETPNSWLCRMAIALLGTVFVARGFAAEGIAVKSAALKLNNEGYELDGEIAVV